MTPIVISFYTLGTPHEKESKRLIASCKEWGIETDIEGVVTQGSWEKNCAFKPSFILKKLKQWERPALWVDAGAVFIRRPDFKDFNDCDLAVRINEFLPKDHKSRIVSNAIFAQNNDAAIAVLEEWGRRAQKELSAKAGVLEFWDQTALRDALHENKDLRFLAMPLKYTKIFDYDDLFISDQEVVIEHYQASRRINKKIHDLCQNHCCH